MLTIEEVVTSLFHDIVPVGTIQQILVTNEGDALVIWASRWTDVSTVRIPCATIQSHRLLMNVRAAMAAAV